VPNDNNTNFEKLILFIFILSYAVLKNTYTTQ